MGSWRLRTEHEYFCDEIWVIIEVNQAGMLAALQGMHGTSIAPEMAGSTASDFGGGFVDPASMWGHQQQAHAMAQQQQQPQQQAMGFGVGAAAGPFAAPIAAADGGFAIPQFGSLATASFGAAPAGFGAAGGFGGAGGGFGAANPGDSAMGE